MSVKHGADDNPRNPEQRVDASAGKAEQTARDVAPWVQHLARAGYISKGFVYVLVGLLTVHAAAGVDSTTDTEGAIREIGNVPLGGILLIALAAGLFGYAAWQLYRSAFDPEHKGKKIGNIVKRIGYGGSGLAYLGLAWYALLEGFGGDGIGPFRQNDQQTGGGDAGGRDASEDWTARFLDLPFGEVLVAIAGLVALGVAFNQFYVAATAKFMKRVKTWELSETQEAGVKRLGQLGLAARGAVISVLGAFLLLAAYQHDADRAGGLGEVLHAIAVTTGGQWMLYAVGMGLFAYGGYAITVGFVRRIQLRTDLARNH